MYNDEHKGLSCRIVQHIPPPNPVTAEEILNFDYLLSSTSRLYFVPVSPPS